jgi:hypothetical protein
MEFWVANSRNQRLEGNFQLGRRSPTVAISVGTPPMIYVHIENPSYCPLANKTGSADTQRGVHLSARFLRRIVSGEGPGTSGLSFARIPPSQPTKRLPVRLKLAQRTGPSCPDGKRLVNSLQLERCDLHPTPLRKSPTDVAATCAVAPV